MTTYQAVSSTAVASTPQTTPAPQIQKSNSTNSSSSSGTLPIVDNDSGNPNQLSWWENRVLEITDTLGRDFSEILTNPSQGIAQLQSDIGGLIADETTHVGEFINAFQPELTAAAVGLAAANLGAVGGFGGFAGLAGLAQPAGAIPEAAPAPSEALPAAGMAPTPAAAAAAPATAPAPSPAPATSTVASSAPPPAPAPAAGGAGFVPPYVVGPPGIGLGSGMSASASSKRKAPESDTAAAAAAAAAREQARARRRRRAKLLGYGHEFMDMNVEVDPDWGAPPDEPVVSTVASDRGAGNLGFTGMVSKETVAEAAGLTTLAGDEFGGGPTMPMVPGTWNPEQGGEAGEGGEHG
jgi:PPE-repeat protein